MFHVRLFNLPLSRLRHYPEGPHMGSTREATWKKKKNWSKSKQHSGNDNKHGARRYTPNRNQAAMNANKR